MDDFTFPITAAAAAAAADTAAAAAAAAEPLRLHHHHHHHRRRGRLHFAASPLWFPSSCPVAAAPPDVPVADDADTADAAVASAVKDVDVVVFVRDAMEGKEQEQEDEEGGGGGQEEATSDAGRREEEEGKKEEEATAAAAATGELSRGDGDEDGGDHGGGGAARDKEEKMDQLWENFNEELRQALHQRVGSCPRADARAAAAAGMELSPETSDAESEPAAAAALRGHIGCAPMLRPSSRAGAGGYRRTATSWVLLMKIFRRLFVIEKTISSSSAAAASASGRHGSARR
uniref:Uncharacterized protein n=1 Tax=Oryza rufipogon TaxID=4529 RepID=A0A0E0P9F5_ORYRU